MARHGRRYLLLAGALFSAAVLALLHTARPRDRITEANAAKIEVGMTRAEVEHILGGPAGDYSTPDRRYGLFGPACISDPGGDIALPFAINEQPEANLQFWWGDSGVIAAVFDKETGGVRYAVWLSTVRHRTAPGEAVGNLVEDARRWLGFRGPRQYP